MAETLPTSLSTALDISPSGDQFSMELPTDIAFGAGEFGLIHAFRVVKVKDLGYRTNKRTSPVSCGGYIASLMAKYAVVHASKHETLRTQTDVRTSLVQFYRPIIASKPVQMQLREVSLEQWILPGWDCLPQGSCAVQKDEEKARWTTEMIQFAIDMSLPVQENFFPRSKRLPMGSVAATLEFAAAQRDSRIQGRPNWRELELDGSKEPITQTLHVTLSMSTEVKRNLPRKGVRWLYLRSEVKRIVDGRMDMEILLCDETMELIAVSQHAAHIIPSAQKLEKGGGKANI
ncbi:hypothetical protein AFGD_005950 [Aspergillus flavus]|nr:hypothetical protein AFGD_005950 [Aspergillus flavus]